MSFEMTSQLSEFISVAARAGLSPVIAIRLACERQLAVDSLSPLWPNGVEKLLDQDAASAQVEHRLCGASASYLRELEDRRPVEPPQPGETLVASIPLRIVDRLLAGDPLRGLHPPCVEQSKRWEIAAMVSGQTMSEWAAMRTALALARNPD